MATYSITNVLTNLTASGDTTIDSGGTATVTLSAESGYQIPIDISVSGADYEYNDATGIITLSSPTGDVTITASALTQEERFYDDMDGIADIISEKSGIPGLKSIPQIKSAAESIRVGGDVTSVNGQTGDVTLTASDIDTAGGDTVEEALGKKANIDGSYEGMSVGNALTSQNIAPVSEESGTIQDAPFISQGTGTANNTSSVDTSSVAKQLEKIGNTVPIMQLVYDGNEEKTETGNVTFSSDNKYSCVQDHKYFYSITIKGVAGDSYKIRPNASNNTGAFNFDVTLTADYKTYNGVFTAGSNDVSNNCYFNCIFLSGTGNTSAKDALFFDITSWGSDIITDLSSNPSHFSWYYNGSLAYDSGTLKNANGRYLVCTGRNLSDGANDFVAIPNRTYYCKGTATITYKDNSKNTISTESVTNTTFTSPANCRYINALGSGITVSLYYPPEQGGEGYDQHYDYIAPKVYDTGTEPLPTAVNVKDIKTPDGTVTHKVGTLAEQTGAIGDTIELADAKADTANIECSLGALFEWGTISGTTITLTKALTNETINYELATQTTEQGTSYPANIEINDYGMMYWLDTNDNLVDIPQGCKVFYPVDYILAIDTLLGYTNGDVTELALKKDAKKWILAADVTTTEDIARFTISELPSGEPLNYDKVLIGIFGHTVLPEGGTRNKERINFLSPSKYYDYYAMPAADNTRFFMFENIDGFLRYERFNVTGDGLNPQSYDLVYGNAYVSYMHKVQGNFSAVEFSFDNDVKLAAGSRIIVEVYQ